MVWVFFFFFFQAEDGIRDWSVTGVQTCALPIFRIGENLAREEAAQFIRLVAIEMLQEFQQVYDLVVSPIADVGPRVVGVNHLPVNAIARDAIRIVATGGRGVEEPADHASRVAGERERQRLPILENVPPIALVI